jgi:phage FluMu protein Com
MEEWRCTRCDKLLARIDGDRLHIRFARGHEYLVGFPATSVCRSCRTLNELRDGNERAAPSQGSSSTSRN